MNYAVFTSHYFTDWILTVTTLVSFIISWTHRRHKQLFLIQIYITASLVVDLLSSLTELVFLDSKIWCITNNVVLNLYSILEFSLICLFIYRLIINKAIRATARILYFAYLVICSAFWATFPKKLASNSPHLFALEGILITLFCLFYFYEFMQSDTYKEIRSNSQFIIISGILFYFSTTVPYYFSAFSLIEISPTFSNVYSCINYCLYTVLFITFIKAYTCRIRTE